MTKIFNLTLTANNTWYNLWELIKASFANPAFDPTFSNTPFIPDCVCELKWQNQTAGSNVYRTEKITNPYAATGFITQGYAWDVDRSDRNVIELKKQNFSSDIAGALLYVSILAN